MILRNHKCINEDNSIENTIIKNTIIEKYNKNNNKIQLKKKKIKLKTNTNNKKKIYKYVLISNEPIIKYYFLSQKEKNDKIKAFNIILKNFKNK